MNMETMMGYPGDEEFEADLLAALRAIAESSGRYDDPEHDADPIEHALVMRDIALGAIAKAEGR